MIHFSVESKVSELKMLGKLAVMVLHEVFKVVHNGDIYEVMGQESQPYQWKREWGKHRTCSLH